MANAKSSQEGLSPTEKPLSSSSKCVIQYFVETLVPQLWQLFLLKCLLPLTPIKGFQADLTLAVRRRPASEQACSGHEGFYRSQSAFSGRTGVHSSSSSTHSLPFTCQSHRQTCTAAPSRPPQSLPRAQASV